MARRGGTRARSAIRRPSRARPAGTPDAAPPAFTQRVLREARRRGFAHAARQVVLGDGAAWIWNLADEHIPGALQIVDLFHAKEHLHAVATGTRLKRAGMHWTLRGANAIIALRCCLLSGRFEAFWERRAAG